MKTTHYNFHLVNNSTIHIALQGPGCHMFLLNEFEETPLDGNLIFEDAEGTEIHIPKRNIMFLTVTPEGD